MEQQSTPTAEQNPPVELPKAKKLWRKPTIQFSPLHVSTQQGSLPDSAGIP